MKVGDGSVTLKPITHISDSSPTLRVSDGGGSESDDSATQLIQLVGERVRAARNARNMSRRELSERSGVSHRYLAQLEGGDGNISIGLLQKVAIALGLAIDSLVKPADALSAEIENFVSLFRKADAAARNQVMQVLNPEGIREQKAERVCLVGLRGAGKTTLGKEIGRAFDAPFIELNDEIEARAGIPVGEIIALYGQEGYRQLEANTLSEIIDTHSRAVVAVAGGIVSEEETFYRVISRFHTVWIKTTAGEHMDRVRAQGDMRPMKGNPRAMIQLREILKSREALYALADHFLDTSGRTVSESTAELSELIRKNRILGVGGA